MFIDYTLLPEVEMLGCHHGTERATTDRAASFMEGYPNGKIFVTEDVGRCGSPEWSTVCAQRRPGRRAEGANTGSSNVHIHACKSECTPT